MIRQWLKWVLPGIFKQGPSKRPSRWPTHEIIQNLPLFEGLPRESIRIVESAESARHALAALRQEPVLGFDTESRPTFVKGEVSSGPHIIQFSTLQHAYIFMIHFPECLEAARELLHSEQILKVGFGLGDDLRRIRAKLQVEPRSILDLESALADNGYGRGMGVKVAVAILFGQRFQKSRRISTSNWNRRPLTDQQLLYAANDAWAALRVYLALPTPRKRRSPQTPRKLKR